MENEMLKLTNADYCACWAAQGLPLAWTLDNALGRDL